MLLDTCFLIDLQRERKRSTEGRSTRFLLGWSGGELAYSLITLEEFYEGYADVGRRDALSFLRPFRLLSPNEETAWQASRLQREMRKSGAPIGDHDAWIAAVALQHGKALLTRNFGHFQRIPGLPVVGY